MKNQVTVDPYLQDILSKGLGKLLHTYMKKISYKLLKSFISSRTELITQSHYERSEAIAMAGIASLRS